MSIFEKTTRISSKGQLTLPVSVRDQLHTDIVRIIVDEDGTVRLVPVPELAGSLKAYAKEYIPVEQAREQAWEQVAKDEEGKRAKS